VDRSLRRFGQLLVVTGALLGAVLGVALALIVNNAASSGAVATSGREVAATSPPSSRPPVARAAGSKDSAAGSAAGGNQRAEWTSRADRHDGKTDNNREGRLGKAEGRGNDKPKDKADGKGSGCPPLGDFARLSGRG
jgi:hypothetical protein